MVDPREPNRFRVEAIDVDHEDREREAQANEGIDIRLALGTAQWSGVYGINNRTGAPEFHDAKDMLAIASRVGIATLDTARGYGDSEALIGASLAATKLGSDFSVVTKLHPAVARGGTSAAEALARTGRSLAKSREALGRDELDVVLLHRYAHLSAFEGAIWRRLVRERERGTIRALGVSAANPKEAWAAIRHPDIEVLQVASSLLDQRLSRAGFFEAAQEAGKRVFVRSVFLQGIAFIEPRKLPNRFAAFRQPLGEIRGMATALQCGLEQLFLAHAATLPGTTAVVGCESASQLRGIVAAIREPAPSPSSVRRLAERIQPLPDRLLDPSRWNELPRVSTVEPRQVGLTA